MAGTYFTTEGSAGLHGELLVRRKMSFSSKFMEQLAQRRQRELGVRVGPGRVQRG